MKSIFMLSTDSYEIIYLKKIMMVQDSNEMVRKPFDSLMERYLRGL